jgi:heterodisulfide reductase subunit B
MKIGYFPGCSLEATAREYDESLTAIAGPLGVELEEIDDWACCGSTPAHQTNHLLSVALPARTLALAEEQGFDRVLAPCAACFSRLATARHEMSRDAALLAEVKEIIDRPFENSVKVVSVAELLLELAPTIKANVKKPLKGTKVACYYGCLLVRPPDVAKADDAEAPSSLETVVEALGATPLAWNRKVDCCGGGLSLSRTRSVVRLGRAILEDARDVGADAVAVGCPMCHSNLDMRQAAIAQRSSKPFTLPIMFITQLVGLALGVETQTLGLDRHFVSSAELLARMSAPALPAAPKPETAKPEATQQEVP